MIEICNELSMLDPNSEDGEHLLSDECCELFSDQEALVENDHFVRPAWLSVDEHIQICTLDDQIWESDGVSINIGGYGYLFPKEPRDFTKVFDNGIFLTFKNIVEQRFGGSFEIPLKYKKYLESRLIPTPGVWAWFATET